MKNIFSMFFILTIFSCGLWSCQKLPTYPTTGPMDSIFVFTCPFLSVFMNGGAGGAIGGGGPVTTTYPLHGLAYDPTGYLYASDQSRGQILKFDLNGNLILSWGNSGGCGIGNPVDLALDGNGNIYEANAGGVAKFSSNGSCVTYWGSYGPGAGQFEYSWGIVIDGSDNVYVSDANDNRIQVFDSNGKYLKQWTASGLSAGLGIDKARSRIYDAVQGNNTIQAFDFNGNTIVTWGTLGSGKGQLNFPNDLAVDSNHFIYVTDRNNNRVQVFDENGNFLSLWGSTGTGNGQFTTPFGITLDNHENVYVGDYTDRIQKFEAGYTYIISPNPVGTGQNPVFEFNLVSAVSYTIDVQDLAQGNNLFHYAAQGVAGKNQVTWNVGGAGNGVYLATFTSGSTKIQNTISIAK